MEIEHLIEKDIQKQSNPFAYTRFKAKLSEEKKGGNYVLIHGLQIISLLLIFAFSFSSFSQTNKEEASFEQFAEENCFDILVNYYPAILFE